jgi:hypothetical protein
MVDIASRRIRPEPLHLVPEPDCDGASQKLCLGHAMLLLHYPTMCRAFCAFQSRIAFMELEILC